jgi:hypothetical protein
MKIQKFNESYQGDKIINQYNNSIILKYNIDVKLSKARLEDARNNILKLLNEYVKMNISYIVTKYNNWSYSYKVNDFHFYVDSEDKRPYFSLSYSTHDSDKIWLKYIDIVNLFKFLEDPELLRNHKKFNI